jgi:predicted dinucleotide-binding enzyme
MSTNAQIAILGTGHVGSALAEGLRRVGYQPQTAGHDREAMKAAVRSAEIVILAVPWVSLDDALGVVGEDLATRIVVDVTNPLTKDRQLALGFSTSGAEELQKKLPRSKVVKAFNTVFAQAMTSGQAQGQALTTFVAGDDAESKQKILLLASSLGFEAIDAGPLRHARLLEPLSYLNIQLGHAQGFGTDSGFRFVHGKQASSSRADAKDPPVWYQPESGQPGPREPQTPNGRSK